MGLVTGSFHSDYRYKLQEAEVEDGEEETHCGTEEEDGV